MMKTWSSFALALAALALPAAGASYTVDKDHTQPSFEFPHMGISVWRGKFTRTSGKVNFDRAARTGDVNIVVQTGSVEFGHKGMNEFAVASDWLNSEQFPNMVYQGKIRFDGDTPVAVDGRLTLLGVSQPLQLRINSLKCIQHPIFKREVCGADAEGDLDRADFGMKLYTDDGMGRLHLRIQVEALKD
jgi:polyisoprenoid-binding protein YceI